MNDQNTLKAADRQEQQVFGRKMFDTMLWDMIVETVRAVLEEREREARGGSLKFRLEKSKRVGHNFFASSSALFHNDETALRKPSSARNDVAVSE